MGLLDRDYMRGDHPPACTCVECSLRKLGKKVLRLGRVKSSRVSKPVSRSVPIEKGEGTMYGSPELLGFLKRQKRKGGLIPRWLIASLFILALSALGIGLSIFTGTNIPFWGLLGFSVIFSIERWFRYYTVKYRGVGKAYRLILNLSMLSLLGLLVWSGIQLFSQQLTLDSLTGSLVFLGELALFIWMWLIVRRNSWCWPSMKLTVFSLLVVAVVFAFAGVEPLSTYKDDLIGEVTTFFDERREIEEARKQELLVIEQANEEARIAEEERLLVIEQANEERRQEEQRIRDAEEAGLMYNGIILHNPSWSQLVNFLGNDSTDKQRYDINSFVCHDFAILLQKNAKEAGWRCAYVGIGLGPSVDYPQGAGHALNAFATTDRGLVYIDCTGLEAGVFGPENCDTSVSVVVGLPYIPMSIFPAAGWSDMWGNMGTVIEILTIQW